MIPNPLWQELFMEADVVFYLFRVDRLLNRTAETERRGEWRHGPD